MMPIAKALSDSKAIKSAKVIKLCVVCPVQLSHIKGMTLEQIMNVTDTLLSLSTFFVLSLCSGERVLGHSSCVRFLTSPTDMEILWYFLGCD